MMSAVAHGLSLEALESRLNLSTLSSAVSPAASATDDAAGVLSATRRYRLASLSAPAQGSSDAAKSASASPAQVYFDAVKGQQAATTPSSPIAPITAPVKTATPPANAHVLQGPIMAVDWNAPATNLTNQTGMIWVFSCQQSDAQIAALAAQSRAKPAGTAALYLADLDRGLLNNSLDHTQNSTGHLTSYESPWLDHGIADVKKIASNFFAKFYADGGRADYIVDDYEGNLSYWGISTANIQAIQADPRSSALTQTLGTNIFHNLLTGNASALYAWNDAMGKVINNALNTAEFNVAAQYFPNARMSNYCGAIVTPQNAVPDLNNWLQYNTSYPGNRQAPVLYGEIGNLAKAILPGTTKAYGNSAFASLRLVTNTMRAAALSSPTPLDPWIAGPGYTGSPLCNTPYYQEAIYHEALDGAETFLNWNPAPIATAAQNTLLDQTLATLNQKLGTGQRWSVTPAEMAWNSPLIVSGMQTATTVVWRVTAPPGTKQIKVVETGEILNLNGAAGLWYNSQPTQAIDFTILS